MKYVRNGVRDRFCSLESRCFDHLFVFSFYIQCIFFLSLVVSSSDLTAFPKDSAHSIFFRRFFFACRFIAKCSAICSTPRLDFPLTRVSDIVGPADRWLLEFFVARIRELVSQCCPLEEASLSSPLCLPTHISAPISSLRCF